MHTTKINPYGIRKISAKYYKSFIFKPLFASVGSGYPAANFCLRIRMISVILFDSCVIMKRGRRQQERRRQALTGLIEESPVRLKLLGCEVMTREVCHALAASPHVIDIGFTRIGMHDTPDALRSEIQRGIDAAAGGGYDAILLCYGLCGNATAGLSARDVPLIIPRAHDCCTLLLGSRAAFNSRFADKPSSRFTSAGYMERSGESIANDPGSVARALGLAAGYADYVRKFGEENARYIWETLFTSPSASAHDNTLYFIDLAETSHLGYAGRCQEQAQAEGLQCVMLPGSIALVEKLVMGEWDSADFLTVLPGQEIAGVYDFDEIIAVRDQATA